MKRLLPVVLGIFVLLVAGLLIGPSFVDWNKYKPQIIEQAKTAAGYDVSIAGDLSLSLLPAPSLTIEGLKVAAPRGRQEYLLNMKEANVSVSLLPLLGGNIVVDTVRFVNPDIQLEILPDGSNSWMSDKLSQSAEDESAQGRTDTSGNTANGQNIAINKLEIKDGRIAYTDRRSGAEYTLEKINMDMKADTLQGPFDVGGSFAYGGKIIEIEGRTKRANGQGDMPVDVTISLPESNAHAEFGGVVGLEPSLELQGQMDVKADNLAQVIAFATGGEASPALAKKLAFSGLVTANETALQSEDIAITFGDTKGQGRLQVLNLKEQNPVRILADMSFEGMINLDHLSVGGHPKQMSVEERVARGEKLSPAPAFIPETLTLPMPIDADVRIVAEGVQSAGKVLKGVTAQLVKEGASFNVTAKILEMPGRTSAQGKITGRFATSSRTGEKGVTYADPVVTFTASGSSEQLPTLLRSFAPEQDGNPALEIWKTAQFDLAGSIRPRSVAISNSTVRLDDTTLALNGSYAPNGAGGRPDVVLDLTSDTINIDHIQSRLQGQKKQVVQTSATVEPDLQKALEPVRGVNVPMNLTFDVSAQKAIYEGQDVNGIRLQGKIAGNALTLQNASVQNYKGAAASLKGSVANLQELSGVDLDFYGRTDDVKSLMQAFKMDTGKLPEQIGAAQANLSAEGKADALAFDASVKALQGQLKASGNMTGLLEKPAFSDLVIGAEHPNFVKAMQIINPSFAGGPGLEKPFSFNAKAIKEGESYNLSGFDAKLGPTTLSGSLRVTPGTRMTIVGDVTAGTVPLDSLLGAKSAGGGSGRSAGASSGEKWSRDTIETGWMQDSDIDLSLKAQAITYGGWNFTNPSTRIVLKNGTLTVDKLASGLFGGTADLSAKIVDPADVKQPLSIAVQSKMENVALEPLVRAMSGSSRLRASGDVNLTMDIQTTGLSAHGLVSGLKGNAALNGSNIIFKGFDLAQLALAFVDTGKPLDRLNSIVNGAVSGGETRFDTVKGAYNIQGGIATISSMALDGPAANIISTGHVNLPAWTIDTNHKVTLKQAKEDGVFNVAIKGSLDNPGNTFGSSLFRDVITRRAQQKVMEKLPDVLGDDLGGKLQDLGILPRQQQQAPAQQTPAEGTAAPQQTAPQPEQPKSLEEQFEEDPGATLRGVLEGLSR